MTGRRFLSPEQAAYHVTALRGCLMSNRCPIFAIPHPNAYKWMGATFRMAPYGDSSCAGRVEILFLPLVLGPVHCLARKGVS